MAAGSVLFYTGALYHGAGANVSDARALRAQRHVRRELAPPGGEPVPLVSVRDRADAAGRPPAAHGLRARRATRSATSTTLRDPLDVLRGRSEGLTGPRRPGRRAAEDPRVAVLSRSRAARRNVTVPNGVDQRSRLLDVREAGLANQTRQLAAQVRAGRVVAVEVDGTSRCEPHERGVRTAEVGDVQLAAGSEQPPDGRERRALLRRRSGGGASSVVSTRSNDAGAKGGSVAEPSASVTRGAGTCDLRGGRSTRMSGSTSRPTMRADGACVAAMERERAGAAADVEHVGVGRDRGLLEEPALDARVAGDPGGQVVERRQRMRCPSAGTKSARRPSAGHWRPTVAA